MNGRSRWPAPSAAHPLGRADIDTLAEPLVARTIALTKSVLADAGVTPAQVKGVVLVGGSTRMPLVRKAVADLFGHEPLADINPDEVVAVGAALQAEALTIGLRYAAARRDTAVAGSRNHGRCR